jgi:DNA-binding transcriptional ArsR family regulator
MSNIASGNTIAEVAALIGDAGRANMLSAMMSGRALTAGELAWHAGITAQTASGHLARLTEAGLIAMRKQGRHRYFQLASADVARAIEALSVVAAAGPKRHRPAGPKDDALRTARTCYDHMAGRLGVLIADGLQQQGHVVLGEDSGIVTARGRRFLEEFGIDIEASTRTRRPLCRTCLDWSERRSHLAGWLGAALLDRSFELGWVRRIADSRALAITPIGQRGFAATFSLPTDWMKAAARPN